MKYKIARLFLGLLFFPLCGKTDITLMGPLIYADGLGRIAIALIDMLHKDLTIDFCCTRENIILQDTSKIVRKVVANRSNQNGKILFFTDSLWYPAFNPTEKLPDSDIKIAYSMLESTKIPSQWVEILNTKFDLVVVPDEWLIKVYKDSGVLIPIFNIPIPLYLDDFLNNSIKSKQNKIFTFGMSAACVPGKNHLTLIKAFNDVFHNRKDVQLKIHARWGVEKDVLINYLMKIKAKNIFFIDKIMSHKEYIDFLSSLDAYVLPSSGEGFSITPREAMAMGIPCLISNNTAHKTICNTKLVCSINSIDPISAYYQVFNGIHGNKFAVYKNDIKIGLKKIYKHYSQFLSNNNEMREYAARYSFEKLKPTFITLFKPLSAQFADSNELRDGVIFTNSINLLNKYKNLINSISMQ